jgi:hypothetical protein
MPNVDAVARLPEHLLANTRLLPNREAILPLLPKHKVVAEVGVALGDYSDLLIRVCEPERFIAIDLFTLHQLPELWGRPTRELFSGDTHGSYYRKRFKSHIEQGKMTILEGDSVAALTTLDDESIDIVYVDAEHSYDAVKSELAVVKRKVKYDGSIILNDYIMNDVGFSDAPYGVIHAVNEFMIAENWEMTYLAFHSHMYCDVVLRKAATAPVTTPLLRAEGHCCTVRSRSSGALDPHDASLETIRAPVSRRVMAPMRALYRAMRESWHGQSKTKSYR